MQRVKVELTIYGDIRERIQVDLSNDGYFVNQRQDPDYSFRIDILDHSKRLYD